MFYMNDKMKAILKNNNYGKLNSHMEEIINNIVNETKIVKDCIVYDKGGDIQENQIDFEKVISFTGDLTGYEVSLNEFRLDTDIVPVRCCPILGDKLYDELSQKYSQKKFVVYISVYDEFIELRFHSYREEDGLWLDENLNKYTEPILCIIK